jgi:hypothetical protein
MLSSGWAKNTSDLQRKVSPRIHVDTHRNALKKRSLNAYVRQSKPLHTAGHRRKQIGWAEHHRYWTADDWWAVIFSDESKFNILGSDDWEWCWRKKGEANNPRYTQKKVKHGGSSVMVWGASPGTVSGNFIASTA